MSERDAKLMLNLRTGMLTGSWPGEHVQVQTRVGSGLQTRLEPGIYRVQAPTTDPVYGSTAVVQWVSSTGLQGRQPVALKCLHQGRQPVALKCLHQGRQPVALKCLHQGRQPVAAEAFVLTKRSLGGWNDVLLITGADHLMQLLEESHGAMLEVVA
jgi:hypothetical protein